MAAMDEVDIVMWACNGAVALGMLFFHLIGVNALASSLLVVCQCLVAFPVFSVMTIRASQETPFRPGNAKTLEEEFVAYGYPAEMFPTFRMVKSFFALYLLLGLVYPKAIAIGAGGILVLMIGAVGSHIKVRDPWQKSVPSITLGSMCACMLLAYYQGCAVVTTESGFLALMATEPARWWLLTSFSFAFAGMLAHVFGVKDNLLWIGNAAVALTSIGLGFGGLKAEATGLTVLCQCLVAFPVFSVMTIRATEETPFRPGEAKNLEQEFKVYGYPSWFFVTIRIVKSLCAVFLVVGIMWRPAVVVGAGGIAALMLGAVGSHIKVKDPWQKSVPSFTLGCMCACIITAYCKGWTAVTDGAYPPSVFATHGGREAALVTMVIVFAICVFQMVLAEPHMAAAVKGGFSNKNEKKEPLLLVN
eukprot:TRINITY_DN1890_c0_g1_i2.p1 TRINITY_DN1890_c0_g1~~TRINITY_DN1890_c0_g1_i2.p1  ORF type:complete len:437 (-),score=76.58 TRINITY_DN1890_c0_g1_i2:223-1473(-)